MSDLDTNELDPKKTEVLDRVAKFVCDKGMAVVAITFLESLKPLRYLGSQALIFFEPFLNVVFNAEKLALFREAMEDKRYLEYLLQKMEDIENS